MQSFRSLVVILCLLMVVVAMSDQLAKTVIRESVSDPVSIIPGCFSLVHWHNTGIAFGLFQDRATLLTLLSATVLVAIPLLFWWEWKQDPRLADAAWGLGLILGGALGNLIDRVRLGYVTDFLLFYYKEWEWPAFNVADSCICIGTGLVLWSVFRVSRESEQATANISSEQVGPPAAPSDETGTT